MQSNSNIPEEPAAPVAPVAPVAAPPAAPVAGPPDFGLAALAGGAARDRLAWWILREVLEVVRTLILTFAA